MQQPIQAYQSTSAPLPSSTATTLTSLCPTTVSTLTTNFNLESNYLFNPIQRVMRYPMLLSSLLKHMGSNLSNPIECRAKERVSQALSAMREVAEAVDRAKSMREVELKTELIASRIELHSSYRSAFVRLLGQIRLVGSLHLLYHGPTFDSANSGLGSNNSEAFKIKYLGVFLYQTHLVIVKAKRATVYEPRHWFPIRYFDLVDVSDHSGLMPYSFSLKFRQHTFEFGAKTEAEKIVWVKELSQVKEEIERQRQVHSLSDQPLGDDSIVSSINLNSHDSINEDQATRGTSMRTPDDNQPPSPVASQVTPTNQQQAGIPGSNSQHNCEELPPTPSALSHPPKVSQRLSRNVNTLLGRTPEVAQAAIDLKLTEVFSEVLLCARLQDSNVQRSGGHTIGHSS
ncbi:hypothetical protein BY996DRAFT_2701458 [Phakopsora pachyrhizi]|nr:hypothetical protein BY996DRAFT_2701458 [Phakopsora pachyrhizi]